MCILDDVFKWKHSPRNWPFVRGIYRSPVNSPHKGQWCVALMFSLICSWTNNWANDLNAGDLRRHRVHYDVTVMHPMVHVHIRSITCSRSIWTPLQYAVITQKCQTDLEPISQTVDELITETCEISFWIDTVSNGDIRSQFCTWHDS